MPTPSKIISGFTRDKILDLASRGDHTQEQIADITGVKPRDVAKLVEGRIRTPKYKAVMPQAVLLRKARKPIRAIAKELGVSTMTVLQAIKYAEEQA